MWNWQISLSLSPLTIFNDFFIQIWFLGYIKKKERENDKDFFETQKIFHFIYFTFSETKNRKKYIEGLRWLNQTKKLSEWSWIGSWNKENNTEMLSSLIPSIRDIFEGKKSNDDDDEKEKKFSIQKMFRITTTITVAWFVLFVIAWLFCFVCLLIVNIKHLEKKDDNGHPIVCVVQWKAKQNKKKRYNRF